MSDGRCLEVAGEPSVTPVGGLGDSVIGQDVTMNVCALSMELHIADSGSLKAKRTVVKHLVEAARSRFAVAAAEVGFQDQWQRAELGFAAVAQSPGHVEKVLDSVERFVWSHPEVTVIGSTRTWLDTGG